MNKCIMMPLLAVSALLAFGCAKKAERGEFTLEKGTLKIGIEIGYPPFEYYAADGKTPEGFDVELGKELAGRLGLQARFIDTAWDGIFAGLDTGRYDIILSAVAMVPSRTAHYDFSAPYIGNGQAIVLRADSSLEIFGPADLSGKKVGYQADSTSDFFMEKQTAAGVAALKSEYDKVMNAYDDLRLGRIDAAVSDYLVATAYVGKPDSEFKTVWIDEPDEYFGVCLKKGNEALLKKIDGALSEMKADGTLKDLYISVFGNDLSDSIK